jgi:hypothetical protein
MLLAFLFFPDSLSPSSAGGPQAQAQEKAQEKA